MATTDDSTSTRPTPPAPEDATPATKLKSWDFFRSMGSPKYHVAPMVDQSELAFRELCRRHGATCAYTPMIHARLFVEDLKYRKEIFTTHINDRPLLVQFCANDPDMLLAAASIVAPHCDGVDINFGCPQRIAKRGRYGAFLMDDWTTVPDLIHKLDQNPSVLANGDIRTRGEADACLEATGADGVLSAEPLLENPSLFSNPPMYEPTDPSLPLPVEGDVNCALLHEYLEITRTHQTPLRMVKGHVHNMVGSWLKEFTDLRDWLNRTPHSEMTVDKLQAWTKELQGRVNLVKRNEGRVRPIPKKSERQLAREAAEAAKEAAIEEQAREEDAVAGASSVDRTRFVFLAFRSISFFARPARVWRVTIYIR